MKRGFEVPYFEKGCDFRISLNFCFNTLIPILPKRGNRSMATRDLPRDSVFFLSNTHDISIGYSAELSSNIFGSLFIATIFSL